jgi:hypothetical protein
MIQSHVNLFGFGLLSTWGRALLTVATVTLLSAEQASAFGVPLTDLFSGGTIEVGSSRFSNWQLVTMDSTGVTPNLAQITVTALANDVNNPGLEFAANGQLAISGINSIDLVLKYRIERLSGGKTYTGHTLAMTGVTFGGLGGISYISDSLAGGGGEISPAVAVADNEAKVFQFTSTASLFPQTAINATTDIFITGLAATDSVGLSTFTQRFAQVGPLGVPGDYNQDGTINAADYTVWRNHLGAPAGTLPNDTVGGVIGQGQYNLWKSNFGQAGSGSIASLPITAVPEPATMTLLFVAVLGCFRPNRNRIA